VTCVLEVLMCGRSMAKSSNVRKLIAKGFIIVKLQKGLLATNGEENNSFDI
jgi:hypothetical protein